jgi:hypothetical protein
MGEPTTASAGTSQGGGPPAEGRDPLKGLEGGLRLRGRISRRSKRTLREDLEVVSYTVTSENGTHVVEAFTSSGGPYISLGELVDLEVEVNVFADRNGVTHHRLRLCAHVGDF